MLMARRNRRAVVRIGHALGLWGALRTARADPRGVPERRLDGPAELDASFTSPERLAFAALNLARCCTFSAADDSKPRNRTAMRGNGRGLRSLPALGRGCAFAALQRPSLAAVAWPLVK